MNNFKFKKIIPLIVCAFALTLTGCNEGSTSVIDASSSTVSNTTSVPPSVGDSTSTPTTAPSSSTEVTTPTSNPTTNSSSAPSSENSSSSSSTSEAPVDTLLSVSLSDNVSSYKVGEVYNTSNELVVKAIYSVSGEKTLNEGYTLNATGFTPSAAFTEAGSYKLTVTYKNVVSNEITITVAAGAPSKEGEYKLVKSTDELVVGDYYIIGNAEKGKTAGDIKSDPYLVPLDSTYTSDGSSFTSLNPETMIFTLGGTTDNWTLSNKDGKKLSSFASKKLAWDNGTSTWKISFDGSKSIIASTASSYGNLQYNSAAPRFTTYTSTQNQVQLYKMDSTPVYATSISLSETSFDLGINEATTLAINYTPSNVNQKDVTWTSSNTEVATVSSIGKVKGLKTGTSTLKATVATEEGSVEATAVVTVKNIPVTGVSVNETLSLGLNSSSNLTVTVAPINATNKDVTWTSSAPSIVSVSSIGVVKGLALGTATITVKTQDGAYTDTCEVTVEEYASDYTIMIYMCGSDLESDFAPGGEYSSELGLATTNIKEILIANIPERVNVLLETGGAKKWETNYGISDTQLGRYHVSNKKLVKDDSLPNASMGDTSTFQSFLEWGLNNYPAEKTGVIMWNHGGAMQGCCYDENFNNDSLLNSEVNTALSNAFTSTRRTDKLDFIGYDCCLMAVQDIADFNSNYFDYMVSSQESEPGEGWDYTNWLNYLGTNTRMSADDLCIKIADTYVAKCAAVYNSYSDTKGFNDATMSVLDLSKAETYRTAWENMAGEMSTIVNSSSAWSSFKTLVNKCQKFGADEYNNTIYYPFDIFDVKDFFEFVKADSKYTSVKNSIIAIENVLNDYIIHNIYGKDSADACGLNFFCPTSGYSDPFNYYPSETNYSVWRTFVNKYGSYTR